MVNLDGCNNGSCKSLDDPFGIICVPNRTEDLNLEVFNTVTRINEWKTLRKHISCKCKCKFDGRKCDSNQKWSNKKFRCECINLIKHHVCENDYIWNPSTGENGKKNCNILLVIH